MSKIENAKTYLGKELENIFFRPLFADEGARELGIKVMYNMPAPTRLHFWHRPDDVLHKYTSAGWNGSASAERYTKTIELHRVKAEMSYSADEYFSLVYDSLAQSALTQLDDLTDAEFVLFTDQVAGELEGTYPVYATFVEMPGVTDTVDMVVVTTIVDELNADARNMRHIFPYNYLVAQGVLPAGLDHDQQKAFYNCFAGKVNDTYDTMSQFFNAILADTTDMSQLRQLQGQCANDLFEWVITEVDVIESVN